MEFENTTRFIPALRWRLSPLALTMGASLLTGNVSADEYFNPAFLSDGKGQVADLSSFENGAGQAPGTYRVDIVLNDEFITSHDVVFKDEKSFSASTAKASDDTGLVACLSVKNLSDMGIDLNIPDEKKKAGDGECITIASLIEGATSSFDFGRQRLDLSVPQVALKNTARGLISSDKWDQGIPAILLNYSLSGSDSQNGDSKSGSDFLGLNAGVNLGAWRYRHYTTFNRSTSNGQSSQRWQHVNGSLSRTIIALKGQLTVGDSYTASDVFDSISFHGLQLASDDNMLPDSLKGFAPTVRGIAKQSAQVTIKQNGYIVYQTYVAPGAFEITDLFPTSSSGDLVVEIKEQKGKIITFSVPYSTVPLMQREGHVKYALTAAKYRTSNTQQDAVPFTQATLIWGLPRGFTIYGGTQLSDNYQAVATGTGLNMGNWGAVSVDMTQAKSTLIDDTVHTGQSWRILYAKSLNTSGTNFQLTGYRYSTAGFYTFTDTTYKHMNGYDSDPDDNYDDPDNDRPHWFDYYNLYYTKRGKLQVNISQQLGKLGSLYVTGSQQTYWHTDGKMMLLQLGYNTSWHDINMGVSFNYSASSIQPKPDQAIAFNVSLPLGKWLSPTGSNASNNAFTTLNMNQDNQGSVTRNAGVSGTLLEGNNLSYSVQQGHANQGAGSNGSASLSHQGGYGNSNVGYSYSENGLSQQVNYGVAGGIIAHQHGVTFSQPLGETNVLVEAPGANRVKVENATGIKTDWRGYAVVPFATTYRKNRIALDTASLGDKVDIENAVVDVVPTKGALVCAKFDAQVGNRALLALMHNNRLIPFGSTVTRDDDGGGGIVGDEGQVYLSGLAPQGKLKVQWGEAADQTCVAEYTLPQDIENVPIVQANVDCR